jgi:putative ABC transport system permease protein
VTGFLALVRFVSLRHLVAAPLRTLLTLIGVALGVAMVVGTRASNVAVLHAFDELGERTSGKSDLEVSGDESGIDQALVVDISEGTRAAEHVAGRLEQTSVVPGGPRVLVLGIDFLGDLAFVPFEQDAPAFRDPLAFVNDPTAVLVSESLARAQGLSVGSPLRLRTAHGVETFHVEAILRETNRTRVYGGQVVVLSLDAAQLAFAREGRLDRIDVALAHWIDFEAGKQAVAGIVGDRGQVDRPSRRGARLAQMTAAFTAGLEVTGMVAVLVGMFLIYNAVSVSVAQRRREIGILRAIGVSRGRITRVFLAEAAVLGVVGASLGVLAGAGMARVVVKQFGANVSRFFENIATPRTEVTPRLALVGVMVGVIATLLAAVVPARRAAALTPIETLRRDTRTTIRGGFPAKLLAAIGGLMMLVGVALVRVPSASAGLASVGLLFVGGALVTPAALVLLSRVLSSIALSLLGAPARLGVDNVVRALGRSALTVSALMVAAALSLTMSTYTHSYEVSCLEWVEQSIPADLFVSAGSPLANDRNVLAFSPEWAAIVAAVPQVEKVDRVRTLSVPKTLPDGRFLRLEVLSLDSSVYLGEIAKNPFQRVVEGPGRIPIDALSREPAALVSENLAYKLALHPGDSIELPSPSGPHRLRVVASVLDYSSDQGLLIIDRRYALEWFHDERLDSLHVYLVDGADPLAVADAVRARLASSTGGDEGLFVTTNAALKEEIRTVVRQTFGISKASEVIALVVAVLGVIGTMIAAVLDRTREIGVLRAIGASRRQVLIAIACEAGMLGLAAAVVAVVTAVPASIVFVDGISVQASGWHVAFRVPWAVVGRVVLGSVVIAATAGVLTGMRAARLRITEALAYE